MPGNFSRVDCNYLLRYALQTNYNLDTWGGRSYTLDGLVVLLSGEKGRATIISTLTSSMTVTRESANRTFRIQVHQQSPGRSPGSQGYSGDPRDAASVGTMSVLWDSLEKNGEQGQSWRMQPIPENN